MENFRDNIKSKILEKRPNLSPSSVKTYVSILFNINKKMNPDNTDIDFFNNHDDILKLLENMWERVKLVKLIIFTQIV